MDCSFYRMSKNTPNKKDLGLILKTNVKLWEKMIIVFSLWKIYIWGI